MNGMMRTLGRVVVVAAVAALVGVSTLAPVGAERVPSGGDSAQRACYAIQSAVNSLISEYGGATEDRKETIIGLLRNLGSNWNALCKYTFGNIVMELPPELAGPGQLGGIDLAPPSKPTLGVGGTTPVTTSSRLAATEDDHERDAKHDKHAKHGKHGKHGKPGGKGRK
jgi:hypothetical protein